MHRPDPASDRPAETTPTPTPDDDRGLGRGAVDRPMPDEDGPHDVPDEDVIEKTLPSTNGNKSNR
jgi:hypothetical protein